ncbi:MAG TPA: lonely Cys domain-containing protein, partial [Streptomyces sp.]|nr:lonely Cys domain-containing protein [Streptomyces sp.]
MDPVTDRTMSGIEPGLWQGRRAYHFLLHGCPGGFYLKAVDPARLGGAGMEVDGEQVGRFLKRRPSVQRLAPDAPIVIEGCWARSATDRQDPVTLGSAVPFVADRLRNISEAQKASTATDHRVIVVDRAHVLVRTAFGVVAQGIATTVGGEQGSWAEVRPQPGADVLDRLARVAGVFGGPAAAQVPDEARADTLILVRALREVFGHEVEDDRDDPAGKYQNLLRGVGALDRMRRVDPKMSEAGEFTLDFLDMVVRARLAEEGTPKPRPVPFADTADLQESVRRVLHAAAHPVTGPAGLQDFVKLPFLDRARAVLQTFETSGALVPLTGAPLPAPGSVVWRKTLWLVAKALEALASYSDRDALAVKVLHLGAAPGPVSAAQHEALLWTMAGAANLGIDAYDPTAMAAYHLYAQGALSKATAIQSPQGEVVGRNFTGMPFTRALDTEIYYATPDGTFGNALSGNGPWHRGAGAPVHEQAGFLVVKGDAGHLDMSWPGAVGAPFRVPFDEVAVLLTMDTFLNARSLNAPLVVIGGHHPPTAAAGGLDLESTLAAREGTARTVLTPLRPTLVGYKRAIDRNVILMTVDPKKSTKQDDWKRTTPPDLPGTRAPVAVVAQAPEAATDVVAEPGPPPLGAQPDQGPAGVSASPSRTTMQFAFQGGAEAVDARQRQRITAVVQGLAQEGARRVQWSAAPATTRITVTWTGRGTGPVTVSRGQANAVAQAFREEWARHWPGPGPVAGLDVTVREGTARRGAAGAARPVTVKMVSPPPMAPPASPPSVTRVVEVLEALRQGHPEFGAGPFDPGPLARRILHMGESDPVDAAVAVELYTLVGEAIVAGRATSVAALGAFHLVERGGALSAARRITDAAGNVRGLDWLGGPPIKGMDATGYVVMLNDQVRRGISWGSDPVGPFVVAARGGRDHVDVPWPDGSTRRVPMDELAELLAMDEELGQYPAAQPALLVWSHAGDGGLEMPRAVSARTGRMVGAHRGAVVLSHPGPGSPHRIEVIDRRALKESLGEWFFSSPEDAGPGGPRSDVWGGTVRLADGSTVRDGEIKTVTIARDGVPFGRAVLTEVDLLTREANLPALQDAGWYHIDPVTDRTMSGIEPGLWQGRRAYHFLLHGCPGGF